MSDINTYANDRLLDFIDAMHIQLKSLLEAQYGESWLPSGVERHLAKDAFARSRKMLSSPMRVVDMGKADDELYGVEHLRSIVDGNWTNIFADRFGDRHRTQVYLGEIAELRHNVSHRRPHHMLRHRDLMRFVHNAQLLLAAIKSPLADEFEAHATTLEQGGAPWGGELAGTLPPATEIVPEFVGRESEMHELSAWLAQPTPAPIVIWGYGGSGKSSLAYHFAHEVKVGAPEDLNAVIWLSAKAREYVGGTTRDRHADFDSVETFGSALWHALYGDGPGVDQLNSESLLQELTETPSLVIVDDLDTVLDNQDLAALLLYDLPRSKSKIIYTSRQRLQGRPILEVKGFSDDELTAFMRTRAREYELDVENCLERQQGIMSVTDGFPLFVDDLLRHAMVFGLQASMEDWSQRKGDAAREYALRRQFESLGEAARKALISVAVANRSVSSLEIADIAGYTDDDVQHAINDLLAWRLLAHAEVNANGQPTFSCNRNTARLVERTYSREPIYQSYHASFRSLAGSGPTASDETRCCQGYIRGHSVGP